MGHPSRSIFTSSLAPAHRLRAECSRVRRTSVVSQSALSPAREVVNTVSPECETDMAEPAGQPAEYRMSILRPSSACFRASRTSGVSDRIGVSPVETVAGRQTARREPIVKILSQSARLCRRSVRRSLESVLPVFGRLSTHRGCSAHSGGSTLAPSLTSHSVFDAWLQPSSGRKRRL
jgi:hypothetical protein